MLTPILLLLILLNLCFNDGEYLDLNELVFQIIRLSLLSDFQINLSNEVIELI
jgi:hypothetical protein